MPHVSSRVDWQASRAPMYQITPGHNVRSMTKYSMVLRAPCKCCYRVDQINDTLLKISGLEDQMNQDGRDD